MMNVILKVTHVERDSQESGHFALSGNIKVESSSALFPCHKTVRF